jgi:hypothetical protein
MFMRIEFQQFKKVIKLLSNFKLLVGPIVIMFFLELAFPYFLHKIPLYLHAAIDPGLLSLAQTSKRSLIPDDYFLILGDSNAAGLGEWFNESLKDGRNLWPDFHTAHILHNKLNVDVISFGGAGAGNLTNMVFSPIRQFKYINSFDPYDLKKPKRILVIFDEGNDISDNIKELFKLYLNKFDNDRIYDQGYFKLFLDDVFQNQNPYKTSTSFLKRLLFSRFLYKGIDDLFYKDKYQENVQRVLNKTKIHKFKANEVYRYPRGYFKNIALVGSEKWVFSNKNFRPPIELTDDEIKLGIYVFEQSLLYASEFFKGSKIDIVFLPSVTSSYHLLTLEDSGSGLNRLESNYSYLAKIKKSGMFLLNEIKKIAEKHGFGFIDVGPDVRSASKYQIIHGVVDQNHFNKTGYHVFSDSIINQSDNLKQFIQ